MIPRINAARLWVDLMTVGKIGFVPGHGVTRTALSEADLQAKEWLLSELRETGLETSTAAAYNVIGRLRAAQSRVGVVALESVKKSGVDSSLLGSMDVAQNRSGVVSLKNTAIFRVGAAAGILPDGDSTQPVASDPRLLDALGGARLKG
jgi:hypothetical protein